MICVLFNRATRKRQSSWKSGIEETSRSTLSPTNTGGGSGRTTPLEGILREVSHYHWCHCGPSRRATGSQSCRDQVAAHGWRECRPLQLRGARFGDRRTTAAAQRKSVKSSVLQTDASPRMNPLLFKDPLQISN